MRDSVVKILADMPYDAFINAQYEDTAKQIRQQIGKEIMEKEKTETEHGMNNAWDWSYVRSGDIRKICQLENDNE